MRPLRRGGRAAGNGSWQLAGRLGPAVGGLEELWCGSDRAAAPASSGNHAFDEYRAETLRRLEEEQKEFGAFLDRLRFAKDKSEFDQFMAERRNHPPTPPEQPQPPTGQG